MTPVPNKNSERGFTLVELLVVVLLLGLLGALTVPGFRTGLARYQLDTAARVLAKDIREVQERVLNEESAAQFKITFEEHRYTVARETVRQKSVSLPVGTVVSTATFGGGTMQVWFRGGVISPRPGGGTVVLRHRATGLTSEVVVKPVTGRVRVKNSWEVSGDQE